MKNLLKTKDFLLLVFVLCGLKSYSQSIAENPCIRFDAAGDTIYTADASAPDCAYKDGRYYFYFPHPSDTDWNNTWKIGIATSTKPASDFTVQGYLELPGDQHAMIDPAVFVDDGQAYFYYGGGNKCMAGKLKANMTELEDKRSKSVETVDIRKSLCPRVESPAVRICCK